MVEDDEQLNNNKWLMEILSRLPVKSILRFRFVSKPWKSLLQSPSLRKLHRERHKSSLPLLLGFHSSQDILMENDPNTLYDYYITIFDLFGKVIEEWTFPLKANWIHVIPPHSQSKLICFKTNKSYFPYNPTTRQLFTLPDPPSNNVFPAYERSYGLPGFVYVPSKDEYVFIELFDSKKEDNWICQILTMSHSNDDKLHYNEWRYIEVVLTSKKFLGVSSNGVFVSGSFYFFAASEENGGRRHNFFLSFEVESEVFSTLEWPQGVKPTFYAEILELKDELYLMSVLHHKPATIDVWKLENKYWNHYWNINLESLGYKDYCPNPREFDYSVFILRFEYLKQYYKKQLSFDFLKKLGKMKLEGQDIEVQNEVEDEDEDAESTIRPLGFLLHTNIYTL